MPLATIGETTGCASSTVPDRGAACQVCQYHRKVNIALDATPLTIPSGGLRRYTEELSRALAETFPVDDFWLFSDQPFALPERSPENLKAGHGPRNVLERRWWLWGLQNEISRRRIELFHGTDFSVPYLPSRPSVMTLHDLSPWKDPAWHADAERVRSRTPLLLRLGLASMVITPSEAIRKEAIQRFRLPTDSVVAVPHAASPVFRPPAEPGPPVEHPYLLYAGTLEPRKNLGLLIDVWRELRRDCPIDLLLAGRRRSDFAAPASEPGLLVVDTPSDEELCRLYAGAVAVLYPSFYEGFGLPILEAMQCGAPVIASRDPAITEVSDGAAILLDATDRRSWVEVLRNLLSDTTRLHDLRARALKRAAEFSWTNTARRTRAVYDQAVRRFRKK